MLFTEDSMTAGIDGLSILDESYYVDSEVATPTTVPVVENSALGAAVVRFSDIEALAESNGCDFIDAMEAVAEQNEIDPEYLAVAVDEARIIEEPELIYELANVVVSPQSENSLAYQFCEACLNDYIDSEGDETFLEAMIDEEVLVESILKPMEHEQSSDLKAAIARNKQTRQNNENRRQAVAGMVQDQNDDGLGGQIARGRQVSALGNKLKAGARAVGNFAAHPIDNTYVKNPGKTALAIGGLAAGVAAYKNRGKIKAALSKGFGKGKAAAADAAGSLQAASAGKLDKIVAAANNKPKSWISQKIAALRGMYSKWLQKAQAESDAGKASVIKKFAAKILACIDALMKKLENATA